MGYRAETLLCFELPVFAYDKIATPFLVTDREMFKDETDPHGGHGGEPIQKVLVISRMGKGDPCLIKLFPSRNFLIYLNQEARLFELISRMTGTVVKLMLFAAKPSSKPKFAQYENRRAFSHVLNSRGINRIFIIKAPYNWILR